MAEPLANSLIAVVKGALHLVERSTYIPSNSPALEKLREGVYETIAELEKIAKQQPRIQIEQTPTPYN